MSPRRWIRRQLQRPIAGHERSTATVCGLLLLLAAAGLILTSPSRPALESHRPAHPTTASTPAARGQPSPRWTPAIAAEANATAATFLHGYLAYLYGHALASQVKDASGAFVGSLEHARGEVPPGIKALHPRVVSLAVSPLPPGHAIATALVTDAEVVHYPIRLLLAEGSPGWQVTGLEGTP
ncbi:MAG TPA: hypothetical protein VMB51_16125 [Solirubrobacteraceae bacterium]|nr:hypothetical protein [Solirubrobacteraceae bacterium]